MKTTLKLVIVAVLASLLVGTVSASPATQTQQPVKVKEAGFLVTTISPVFIAIEKGYFLDEGLDFEYVQIDSGALGAMAITTGLAQFTDLGVSDVIDLQKQGKDPILVYSLVNSLTMNLVVRNEVLDKLSRLPVGVWSYQTEGSTARHIGPMAQDFMATFGVGSSDRTILQVDADGVSFAAIQALNARLTALEEQNQKLLRELEQRRQCCKR